MRMGVKREARYCGSFTLRFILVDYPVSTPTFSYNFCSLSSLLLRPTQHTTERKRTSEKIGRWYGADQKESYICSFSSLCLMDRVSCSMESRCGDRCVAAGNRLFLQSCFPGYALLTEQSNCELPASYTNKWRFKGIVRLI